MLGLVDHRAKLAAEEAGRGTLLADVELAAEPAFARLDQGRLDHPIDPLAGRRALRPVADRAARPRDMAPCPSKSTSGLPRPPPRGGAPGRLRRRRPHRRGREPASLEIGHQVANRVPGLEQLGDLAELLDLVCSIATMARRRAPWHRETIATFPDPQGMAAHARQFRDRRNGISGSAQPPSLPNPSMPTDSTTCLPSPGRPGRLVPGAARNRPDPRPQLDRRASGSFIF